MGAENPLLREKLDLLPDRPGVYLFKDAGGRVIYVGKARSLRHRVRSYFQSARNLTARHLRLANDVHDVDAILVDSDVEALALENTLIKQHRPRHNIRLRDDKQYPYLRVTVEEDWPRVLVVRQMRRDGSRYFGPYTSASAMRETLRLMRRAFPFRNCSAAKFARCAAARPCLDYYIGRCLGPCRGLVGPEAYRAMIDDLCRFLEGRQDDIIRRSEARMHEAAERLDFERAAEYRNQLQAMERVVERQKVVLSSLEDFDALALARSGDVAGGQVFWLRGGKLVGREYFTLNAPEDQADGAVMTAFVQQYYARAAYIPREILVQHEVEAPEVLQAWLAGLRGGPVRLRRPRRGEKKQLVDLVARNAAAQLEADLVRTERQQERTGGALEDLAELLGLEQPPERVEAFDISNLHGWQAVGSMVVFEHGVPARDQYRRFRVRTVAGPDDFAMMREVLARRFRRGLEEQEVLSARGARGAPDDGGLVREDVGARFAALPDLVVIDGGKGQLNAAVEVLEALGLGYIPAIGLAKRFEEVFVPGRPDPLPVPKDAPALYFLQRLRDEAHRFAVEYHRNLRGRRAIRSTLEDIPGVGKKRRTALLRHFGSAAGIRQASLHDLAKVPGMNRKAAEAVYQHFHPEAR